MLRPFCFGFATAFLTVGPLAAPSAGQVMPGRGTNLPSATPADSSDLHSDARSAQARFERIRIRQSPIRFGIGGPCDERVGRMCIHLPYGESENDWEAPPENERIVDARKTLLRELEEVGRRIPGDGWVLGQRVAYLGEAGEWDRALELASDCPLARASVWWCAALQGTALHRLGRFVEAEAAFDATLEGMSEAERREWTDLERLVEPGLRRLFRDAEGDSLAALEARLWALADPLLLVPGNDRRTEHLSRHAQARIRSDARIPYAMSWGSDLAEILVRYGPEVAYEREPARPFIMGPDAVLGRFESRSRRFLPEEGPFLDPSAVEPAEWRTDERRARSRHAPPYAPRIGGLDVEQFLFRRDGDLLVILLWEPAEGPPEWPLPDEVQLDETPDTDFDVGLFLLREVDLAPAETWTHIEKDHIGSDEMRGLAMARVPSGRYLASLEVLDMEGKRAWRSRHGVARDPIPRGVVALSDLVLLEPDSGGGDAARCPGTIEGHVHRLRSGRALEGRTVTVAWEVYGLEGEDGPLRFHLAAAPEERGLLRRAGEFLRILRPEDPLELVWEEGVPPDVDGAAHGGPLLRCVRLDLSALPGGRALLDLRLGLPGRTEIRAERSVALPDE